MGLKNKIGKFFITKNCLHDIPELLFLLFAKTIIIRAKYLYELDRFEYYAFSNDFNDVPEGQEPPTYDVLFHNTDENETPTIQFIIKK